MEEGKTQGRLTRLPVYNGRGMKLGMKLWKWLFLLAAVGQAPFIHSLYQTYSVREYLKQISLQRTQLSSPFRDLRGRFRWWDSGLRKGPVTGIAGNDAHQNVGLALQTTSGEKLWSIPIFVQ